MNKSDESDIENIESGRRITHENRENIVFYIGDEDGNYTEYQLTWWNQKGKYKPNALAIFNLTKYKKKKN